jgi:DnaJ-domain-containing protein 1
MSDAFELFGIDPAFDLDLTGLERRHRELCRALHPVRRAETLLGRLGVAVEERREPPTDPGLLMELLELRERLAEARATCAEAALGELADEVRQRQVGLEARMASDLASALDGASPGTAPPPALAETLLSELGELRYYRKFLDDVGVIQDELF